jgi:hypothetical protein
LSHEERRIAARRVGVEGACRESGIPDRRESGQNRGQTAGDDSEDRRE